MKEKGFTLIELLAVIVILAIIALIATPVVLNIIKDSKNSSTERSAELYLSQVKNEIARYNMIHPGSNFNPSECIVQSDNTLNCDGTIVAISIDGTKPKSGSTIVLSNGTVTSLKDFIIDGKNIALVNGNYKVSDSSNKAICEAVTTATTGNVPSGNFNYGDEYTCDVGDGESKTFFVLETNGDNVSLIMNANIDSNGKAITSSNIPADKGYVVWISKDDYIAAGGEDLSNDEGDCQYANYCVTNEYGPITALKYLKKSTANWIKLTESQITLPSYKQVYKTKESESELFAWLYGNLGASSTQYPYGYWTSTPCSAKNAMSVHASGNLYGGDYADYGNCCGARPVITILKSDIQ